MSKRRVVITGLGMVTPLGLDVESSWRAACAGASGAAPITAFDAQDCSVRIACEVKNFKTDGYIDSKDARRMDRFIQYGVVAGMQAMQDSGLEINEQNRERVGVIVGSGIGGLATIESNYEAIRQSGPRKVSPFFVPGSIINMVAGHLSIRYGLTGPNLATVTACTSGSHSIGQATRLIQYGDADVMLAGGSEMCTTPLGVGGFAAARALSTRNEDPTKASRPWDKNRDGFVIGDGAGVLVMEEYEHAKARGAKVYAEIVGFGMSGDAHHMTSPPTDGAGAALAMRNALRDAGIVSQQLNYINAHGTSTHAGDLAEIRATKSILGDAGRRVMVSSTKSMTGHLLGAAGAIEAIFSVLALRDQIVPPTINLDEPDEQCDLDLVPLYARQAKLNYVMSNSFGFGGTNGSLVFRKM